ncbi:MAG: hypothetical protein ACKPBB_20620 [Sphaerospermopsis kisseleviana]
MILGFTVNIKIRLFLLLCLNKIVIAIAPQPPYTRKAIALLTPYIKQRSHPIIPKITIALHPTYTKKRS